MAVHPVTLHLRNGDRKIKNSMSSLGYLRLSLSYIFLDVKKHHDQENLYKKALTGVLFQRVSA